MLATTLLLLLGSLAPISRAQQTWGGFRFGMSPEDVKRVFNQPMHQATGVEIVKDFPITLVADRPIAVQRINVIPKFTFDANRRLQIIFLDSQRDGSSLDLEVARRLLEQLAGKYGLPVLETASCAADEPERPCRATWRSEQQHITVGFRAKPDRTLSHLFLSYEANPADI